MSLLDTASLLLTPNAYKEGKLYSVIPSDGTGDFTFTRATTATRMNSNGLVELVPYNLFSWSEDFTNGYWVKTNTSITANSINSPIGTLTADTITDNTTSGQHKAQSPDVTSIIGSGNDFYVSAYFKANTATRVAIYAYGSSRGVGVDLTNGTQITINGLTNAPSSDVTITNVGNDWYKVTMKGIVSGSFSIAVMMISGNDFNYVGSGNSLYMWGAQLVVGSTAKDYQKTETRLNIPRLDYSNGTCPSILLEPQRTNLVTYSEQFDNAAWSKGNTTITSNITIAPNGTNTADKVSETSATGFHFASFPNGIMTSTNNYTLSFYVKAAERNWCSVYLYDGTNLYQTFFDLTNGVIGTTASGMTANIESVGNGWYRCAVSRNIVGAYNANGGILTALADNQSSYTGTTGSGIYAWGAQLEAGSYATSYIPTTTASVTRNAEVCNKTGISSLIGATQGTLYFELKDVIELDFPCITIDDGTNNNRFLLYRENPTGRYALFVAIGGVAYANYSTISANDGKFAIAYNGSGFVVYRNGVQIITSTNAIPSNLSAIRLNGRATNDLYAIKKVYSTALWKTRLTNDQLAQLTTI